MSLRPVSLLDNGNSPTLSSNPHFEAIGVISTLAPFSLLPLFRFSYFNQPNRVQTYVVTRASGEIHVKRIYEFRIANKENPPCLRENALPIKIHCGTVKRQRDEASWGNCGWTHTIREGKRTMGCLYSISAPRYSSVVVANRDCNLNYK